LEKAALKCSILCLFPNTILETSIYTTSASAAIPKDSSNPISFSLVNSVR